MKKPTRPEEFNVRAHDEEHGEFFFNSPPFRYRTGENRWYNTHYPPCNDQDFGLDIFLQNTLYVQPHWIPEPVAIDMLAVYLLNAGGAGAVIRLGVYLGDGNGYWPESLLLDAGTTAADSGANSYHTISVDLELAEGWHWMAYVTQGSATLPDIASHLAWGNASGFFFFGGDTGAVPGATTTEPACAGRGLKATTTYAGALPGSWSDTGATTVVDNIPNIPYRVA